VKPQRISCALLLPLAELALWSTLVVIPTLFMYGGLYSLQKHEDASIRPGQPISPRDGWLGFSLATVCERQFHTIANLNLPGALIGAPLSLPVASYLRTHPTGFSVETWHTVTIPFFCLPAWWLIGIGIEGALTQKRLHWGLIAVGSIFSCACIALAIGILASPPVDRGDLLPFMPGTIFWAVAFGLAPLAYHIEIAHQH
jgi:hypothetical protein